MTRNTASIAIACTMMALQVRALAICPSGYPDEIFCDDFDTYCSGGGFPGSPPCPLNASKHDVTLGRAWHRTSINEYNNNLCGVEFTVEDDDDHIGYALPVFNQSPPFGVRFPCQTGYILGQQTFRDWSLSPNPPDQDGRLAPGQILNLSRLIKGTFGNAYTAVAATDPRPLVMEFFMGGGVSGAINYATGYMELAMGDLNQRVDASERANTDYIMNEDCNTFCSPPINQGPFAIMCAQGNPGSALPAGCPPIASAPVRKALAVGVLGMLDTNPCHCGSTVHGGANAHLVVFDGKQWWTLRKDDPRLPPTTGEVIQYKPSSVLPPPPDIAMPGDFDLAGGEHYGKTRSYNWVKLTVFATSMVVELTTLQKSTTEDQYWVTSRIVMPREYAGEFNTVRGGIGPACALDNQNWSTCVIDPANGARTRRCLSSTHPQAGHVDFNDFVLHGGAGYTQSGARCQGATCSVKLPAECAGVGGTFRGPSTTCEDSSCVGACCKGPNCQEVVAAECDGAFGGLGTTCATAQCPCSADGFLWADADVDGDVDMDDFGRFQACFAPDSPVAANCDCLDRVPNDGVDGSDFASFAACTTGANVPYNVASLPSGCNP